MAGTLHDRLRSLEACALILHGSIQSAVMPNREAVFTQILSRLLAPKRIRGYARPFGHGSELVPNYFRRDVLSACKSLETTIGAGDDALFVSDSGHRLAQTLGDHLRVPGIEHVCGQRMLFERLVLVLMARIGELDRQGAEVRAVELRQDRRHDDVAYVRPIVRASLPRP